MVKKIIAFILILALLGGAFYASYTLSLRYWDKIAPYIDGAEVSDATPTQALPVLATPTEAVTAETTTEPVTAPISLTVTTVDMPEDDAWQLILLDRTHKISDAYVPELTAAIEGSDIRLDSRVAKAFQEMYDAAKAEGVDLTPVSGYVSTEIQTSLFDQKVEELIAQGETRENAMAIASQTILPGGCSEDNVGISVSVGMQVESFSQSAAYRWLQANAAKYGFIERYTAEKKAFTQVNARPWYWRYVGADNAKLMTESGLCLEEYLQR